MKSVRISLTPELEKSFKILEREYPTLDKVEITKLAVGELTKSRALNSGFYEIAGEKQSAEIEDAVSQVAEGNYTTTNGPEEMSNYLSELEKEAEEDDTI